MSIWRPIPEERTHGDRFSLLRRTAAELERPQGSTDVGSGWLHSYGDRRLQRLTFLAQRLTTPIGFRKTIEQKGEVLCAIGFVDPLHSLPDSFWE